MKKRLGLTATLLASGLLFGLSVSHANTDESGARVVSLGQGTAVRVSGSGDWATVTGEKRVHQGDFVRAGQQGAILHFDGTVVRAAAGAELRIVSTDEGKAGLDVKSGRILSRSSKGQSIKVTAPNGAGAGTSGGTFSLDVDGSHTRIKVVEGDAKVEGVDLSSPNFPNLKIADSTHAAAPLELVALGPEGVAGHVRQLSDGSFVLEAKKGGNTYVIKITKDTKIIYKDSKQPAELREGLDVTVYGNLEGSEVAAVEVHVDRDDVAGFDVDPVFYAGGAGLLGAIIILINNGGDPVEGPPGVPPPASP